MNDHQQTDHQPADRRQTALVLDNPLAEAAVRRLVVAETDAVDTVDLCVFAVDIPPGGSVNLADDPAVKHADRVVVCPPGRALEDVTEITRAAGFRPKPDKVFVDGVSLARDGGLIVNGNKERTPVVLIMATRPREGVPDRIWATPMHLAPESERDVPPGWRVLYVLPWWFDPASKDGQDRLLELLERDGFGKPPEASRPGRRKGKRRAV